MVVVIIHTGLSYHNSRRHANIGVVKLVVAVRTGGAGIIQEVLFTKCQMIHHSCEDQQQSDIGSSSCSDGAWQYFCLAAKDKFINYENDKTFVYQLHTSQNNFGPKYNEKKYEPPQTPTMTSVLRFGIYKVPAPSLDSLLLMPLLKTSTRCVQDV